MMTNLIEEALTEFYGERCPDYEWTCICCVAWKQYDTLCEMVQEKENKEEKQDGQ
jgi:hypothetical protein